MHSITKRTLKKFWEEVPSAKGQLEAWHNEAKRAAWKTPHDIKALYGSANILKNGRVVFNICGNNYRLVVRINYKSGLILIRFIGTHEEYDAIDAETI